MKDHAIHSALIMILVHMDNILSSSKPKYHQIEKIANYDDLLVGLEEAYEDFSKNFSKAVELLEAVLKMIG